MAVLEFDAQSGAVGLRQLLGLPALVSPHAPRRAQGLFELRTASGTWTSDDVPQIHTEHDSSGARFVWRVEGAELEVESCWEAGLPGVISRRDTVRNVGSEPVGLLRFLSRVVLAPAPCRIYSQQSRWCWESQGYWQALTHGVVELSNVPGRSAEGAAPYACLVNEDTGLGIGIHVVPRGDWSIRLRSEPLGGTELRAAVIEAGQAHAHFAFELEPGASFEAPELLLHALPHGDPSLGAPIVQQTAISQSPAWPDQTQPIIYNTWFDRFDALHVERLHAQLEAARGVGCEVFVVDAGWFGEGPVNWWGHVGDWREKQGAAFDGKMADFADAVRAAGLVFGVWMEAERFGADAPVVKKCPDWFLPGEKGGLYIDLANPEAFEYQRAEISRVIETYGAGWIKLDFNFALGADPRQESLRWYQDRWFTLVDELRKRFPHTVFENCASGGLRVDLANARHYHCCFPSDTIEPCHMLRILEGTALRHPLHRVLTWAGLRPGATEQSVGAPGGALWDNAREYDAAFVLGVALLGVYGLTGALADLPAETRALLRRAAQLHKDTRALKERAVAHVLTRPRLRGDTAGWSIFQLQACGSADSLVFAYRLGEAASQTQVPLRNLDPRNRYAIEPLWGGGEPIEATGGELAAPGLALSAPKPYSALIRRVKLLQALSAG